MRVYLVLLVMAALVTYATTPMMRHLAFKVGAVTAVRDRDVHTIPTARLGGLAILLGIGAGVVVASQIPFLQPVFASSSAAWSVVGASALLGALGFADDLWDLDWMVKLGGQVLSALVLAWGGVQIVSIPLFGRVIGSSYLSLALTVLVVVVSINAVNFVDGLDGLAAGMVGIGAAAFFVYTYGLSLTASPGDYSSLASVILVILVGVCAGFLPHNAHPARIFMGDSGSMVLGLTIAAASIIVTGQIDTEAVNERQAIPAFIPILLPLVILAVPLIDMTAAVIRRSLRGQSPWKADAHHMHHLLLRFGHTHRWAVTVLWLWTFVLSFGIVSLIYLRGRYALALLAVGLLLVGLVTFSAGTRRALSRAWRWMGGKVMAAQRITPEAAGYERNDDDG